MCNAAVCMLLFKKGLKSHLFKKHCYYYYYCSRPKDLMSIKKDLEAGVIRTTEEFHRDMLLMFTNAMMFNKHNSPVSQWAAEMFDDVNKQIEV